MQRIKNGKPIELTPSEEAAWRAPLGPPVRKPRHIRADYHRHIAKYPAILALLIENGGGLPPVAVSDWLNTYKSLKAELDLL